MVTKIILNLTDGQLAIARGMLNLAADPNDVDYLEISDILEQLQNELIRTKKTNVEFPTRDI